MTVPTIALPEEVEGLTLIASVSGGKDSTALLLALREAELPHRAVFADTGWEAPETYSYLDTLREKLGITIDVVGVAGGMRGRVMYRAGFPARMQRWCTRELKIEPLRAYHDAAESEEGETVSVLGIRAAESEARSRMAELDDEPVGRRSWGGWVWRPLIRWTIADVLGIHSRHGIPVNPLYRRGHDRVGCYPCIYARKEEVRLLPAARVAEIRALEVEVTEERARRNAERPGRYTTATATFFQGRGRLVREAPTIDDVVAWSRTERGGRQLPLLAPVPTGGCMRWGLCDMPPEGDG